MVILPAPTAQAAFEQQCTTKRKKEKKYHINRYSRKSLDSKPYVCLCIQIVSYRIANYAEKLVFLCAVLILKQSSSNVRSVSQVNVENID